MARDGEAPHHLTFERRGPVEWITIDRPRALNALAAATLRALRIRFEALRYEPDIRVVILIGAGGKAFSTGLDVKEAVSQSASCPTDAIAAEVWRQQRGWSDTIKALRSAPQPVIALLDGLALGGGFGLALAADVRLATESTRMNVQSVLIGTTGCDIGISYYLPRSVGARQRGIGPPASASRRTRDRAAPPPKPTVLDEGAEIFMWNAMSLHSAGAAFAGEGRSRLDTRRGRRAAAPPAACTPERGVARLQAHHEAHRDVNW